MKFIKKLNWSGYSIVLILSAVAALANPNVVNFISWFVVFLVGAFLGLFILIAGKKD